MKLNLKAGALAALAGSALLLAVPAAQAQDASSSPQKTAPPTQQMQPTQHANFSDKDLHSFVDAAKQVQKLSVEWGQKLKKTDDAEKSKKIRLQATEEIRKAVRDQGLTVEKYNRISLAARQDKALREKLVAYLKQSK